MIIIVATERKEGLSFKPSRNIRDSSSTSMATSVVTDIYGVHATIIAH